jgi:hypothetical protein
MAEAPDRIKQDIAETRSELARDVDALADRTLPNRVARRRWDEVKAKARTVSDKVMGTPDGASHGVASTVGAIQGAATQVGQKAGDVASSVATSVREAPGAVVHGTQGNPIAAGVIAFGVGLLAASLIPATELERKVGQQIKDNAGDLVEQVREPLTESAEQIKEDAVASATVALDDIKQTAKDATQATKEQATSSIHEATEGTKHAVRDKL